MSGDREELIRQRAYALWEKDGGRHGRHDDHWAEATRQIDGEPAQKAKRAVKAKAAPAAKTSAAKPSPLAKVPTATKVSANAKAKLVKTVPKSPKVPPRSRPKTG